MTKQTPTEKQIASLQKLPQSVAAFLAGMSPRNLRSTNCPRSDDGTYDARAVVEWLIDRQSAPITDDVLLSTPTDSPALEKYRAARAAMAELDLAVRKGELIDVAAWRELMARWAARLRRCGETLARKFGNDALAVQTDALNDCGKIADTFLTELESKGKQADK